MTLHEQKKRIAEEYSKDPDMIILYLLAGLIFLFGLASVWLTVQPLSSL